MGTAATKRDPTVAHDLLDELRRSRPMLAEAQQLTRIGGREWDTPADVVTLSDELSTGRSS